MATKHLENAWAEILPWQSEIRKKDQLYSRKKPLTEQTLPPVRTRRDLVVNDSTSPVGLSTLKQAFTSRSPRLAAEAKEKGNALFQRQKFKEAIEQYTRAIELDPSCAVYFLNRAMANLKVKNFVDAEKDCNSGLELQPDNVKALWRRGIAKRELGRTEEARQDFERALAIEPNNKSISEELAKLPRPKKDKGKERADAPHHASQRQRLPIEMVDAAYGDDNKAKATQTVPQVPTTKTTKKESPIAKVPPAPSQVATQQPISKDAQAPKTAVQTETPQKQDRAPVVPKETVAQNSLEIRPPKSNLEFERDWKTYKHRGPETLFQYFKSIPPSSYASLFRSSLESDQFEEMLDILNMYYTSNEDIYAVLQGLAQVRRIDMLIMFLGAKHNRVLCDLFTKLKGSVPDADLGKLAKVYDIKSL
ncbi:hypothetical protein VTP01DRAFT_3727 [Rhizomucor pusillus]|uniref:uncharacterized protein n=1 Tax=Rhizomucor pusillus TaxID=4840 RepID=UPI003742C962